MAFQRPPGADNSGPRPDPGAILLVIHDFQARSSDELSLMKGDRVELVERDDDFGDGWYLGKHLVNGSTGLFPEVYTKAAPRGAPSSQPLPQKPFLPVIQPPSIPGIHSAEARSSLPVSETDKPSQPSRHVSASQVLDSNVTSPLVKHSQFDSAPFANGSPRSISLGNTPGLHDKEQDSPVMNETLSVIQEHMSDMNMPRNGSSLARPPLGTNDSGSDYSSHVEQRMSYINGEETDEEEEGLHSESEVSSWNAMMVSDYLADVGVEPKHCEVFREQEITGDVLLGMDQTSVFLKEFDLGSVGRRLKTWQKIKSLQDEVKGAAPAPVVTTSKRNTRNPDNDSHQGGSSFARNSNVLDSQQPSPRFVGPAARSETMTSTSSPASPKPTGSTVSPRRPSAASIRDLHHSRRSSANEFSTASLRTSRAEVPAPVEVKHKKQPSFDRNWTMGSNTPTTLPSRPTTAVGHDGLQAVLDETNLTGATLSGPVDLDRGYFSGSEADGRPKNVLKKKTENNHSRNSSYINDQRVRSIAANARHSRFSSVDSMQQANGNSPASQKYHGLTGGRRRTPSADTVSRPPPPLKDMPSPMVTKLDGISKSAAASPSSPMFRAFSSSQKHEGTEKSSVHSKGEEIVSSPTLNESLTSQSRAGSSTASKGPSFEMDSNPSNSPSTMTTPGSRASRKKTKQETSAYTRGLEKKSPQEQMISCDFSGWMKKKSTNLMTTWKPRLFVLKGRRLSYYYSEDDKEEKGLIDISFHRVLPADNERLTGLHATLTGAATSPTSPQNSTTPTIAATEAANEPQSTLTKSTDQMFIFKLVPPRAGLSRAVNFTKPTVHYFAVPNVAIGRLWMAALMKATIDRDDSKAITTTYNQKTISLAKAKAMRHRPPALMNLDEKLEDGSGAPQIPALDNSGLNIQGLLFEHEGHENDSGVSGFTRTSGGTAYTTIEPAA